DFSRIAISGAKPSRGLQQFRSSNVSVLPDQQSHSSTFGCRYVPSDHFDRQLFAARTTERYPSNADRDSEPFVSGSVRGRSRTGDSGIDARDVEQLGCLLYDQPLRIVGAIAQLRAVNNHDRL